MVMAVLTLMLYYLVMTACKITYMKYYLVMTNCRVRVTMKCLICLIS